MSGQKIFMKIVVIGDSGVGKTSLLQQYMSGKMNSQTKPTIGADFSKKVINVDGQEVTLQIWDTAGQERFQSLGYAFYRGADCCALVYDITNSASFENLNKWKLGFIENASPADAASFPFCVFGNKADKEDDRQVTIEEEQKWCEKNSIKDHYETSAKTAQNVQDAFESMVKKALVREKKNKQSLTGPLMKGSTSGPGGVKLNQRKTKETQAKSACEC